jgi:hypothetical protein
MRIHPIAGPAALPLAVALASLAPGSPPQRKSISQVCLA